MRMFPNAFPPPPTIHASISYLSTCTYIPSSNPCVTVMFPLTRGSVKRTLLCCTFHAIMTYIQVRDSCQRCHIMWSWPEAGKPVLLTLHWDFLMTSTTWLSVHMSLHSMTLHREHHRWCHCCFSVKREPESDALFAKELRGNLVPLSLEGVWLMMRVYGTVSSSHAVLTHTHSPSHFMHACVVRRREMSRPWSSWGRFEWITRTNLTHTGFPLHVPHPWTW